MVGVNPLLSGVLAISCCYSLYLAVAQTTNPTEVNALRAIRKSLVDPMGNLHTWNSGDPCTSYWLGIACNSSANDHYLHVQELFLLNLNLSGCLAPELSLLSHLKILLLSGNQLSGSLPTVLGYLPNLKRMQIDQNHISASIPKSFASLNRVVHFQLDNNNFSGNTIPDSYVNMTELRKLVTLIQSISEPICYQTRAMFIAWELFS